MGRKDYRLASAPCNYEGEPLLDPSEPALIQSSASLPRPPGPSRFEILKNLWQLLDQPLPFWTRWKKEHGDLFQLDFGVESLWIATHPETVREVYLRQRDRFVRGGPTVEAMKICFGRGLLTSEPKLWKRQRRLLQPLFSRARLEEYFPEIRAAVEVRVGAWREAAQKEASLDAYHEGMRLAIGVLGRAMAGPEILPRIEAVDDHRLRMNRDLARRFKGFPSFPEWVPTPANRRILESKEVYFGIFRDFLAARKKDPDPPPDMLTRLLEARDPDTKEPLPEDLLLDELMTMASAGYDTTALTLTWCLYRLLAHPEERALLVAEVRGFSGPPQEPQDLDEIPRVRAFLQEVLRLHPPVPALATVAQEDTELGGFSLRKGEVVVPSIFHIHRSPDFFPEPEVFRPERFLGPPNEAHRIAYLPFGIGPHKCIGQPLAELELHLALVRLLQEFELQGDAPEGMGFHTHLVIEPDRPVPFRLQEASRR